MNALWIVATLIGFLAAGHVNAKDLFLFAGQSNMEGWSNWSGGAGWKYLDRSLFDDVANIIEDSGGRGTSIPANQLADNVKARIYQAQLLKSDHNASEVVSEAQTQHIMDLYARGLMDGIREPVPGAWCSFWTDRNPLHETVPVSHDSMCGRMYGHEFMFSKSLVDIGIGDFAVHKVAVGGKKIEEFMKPSNTAPGTYWRAMYDTIHNKFTDGDSWAGIVWHQGSQNSWDDSYKQYGANLQTLMEDLRSEMCAKDPACLNPSNIPAIIVQNGYWPGNFNADVIRTAQENFTISDRRAAIVSTKDLGRFFHYDATSFLISGDRIAKAMAPLVLESPPSLPPGLPSDIPASKPGGSCLGKLALCDPMESYCCDGLTCKYPGFNLSYGNYCWE